MYHRTHSSAQWRNIDHPKLRALLRAGAYQVLSKRDGIVVVNRAARAGNCPAAANPRAQCLVAF